ncbi:GNAT family N-acetyltransferase [Burkholderiaceae bacterium UC74_6]
MAQILYTSVMPSAEALKALYDTTGWTPQPRPVDVFAAALAGSWSTCSAYAAERLVGFGRVISDGVLHAYLNEMIVAPDQQGLGIGRQILDRLVAHCLYNGVTDIQLFCAEGKEAFYRKGGFVPRGPSRPGMQYLPHSA